MQKYNRAFTNPEFLNELPVLLIYGSIYSMGKPLPLYYLNDIGSAYAGTEA